MISKSIIPFLEVFHMDYQELENKPTINGVVLEPNMELSDIGLVEMTPGMVAELVLETFGIIL